MKAKTKKGIKYTLLSALVALVGTVTIAASNPDFALGRNIQILFNMFRELNLLYVDQIDPDEMLLDAADGMTSKLDPYTELIPEKEMADFEIMTTGKYGGMGAMIRQKDDYVMIAQPYKNSPADKAGLVVGDLLLEVNGESIKGYEVSKVSSMLKGTPGTTLHLKVRKLLTGQEEELTFKRERIVVSGIPYWSVIDDSIGYIVHKDFSEDCSNDIRNAVMSMKKAGIKGLIIDLRGNGGGVMPDIRMPDNYYSRFTNVLYGKGYIEDFANLYYKKHREGVDVDNFELSDADYNEFVRFMADKPVDFESETQQTLSQLRQKAERDKYLDRIEGELNAIEQKIRDDKQADLQAFKKEIKELIGDEIVMRYHYIQGVARHNSHLDPEILEAIKVLQDPARYHQIITSQDTQRK